MGPKGSRKAASVSPPGAVEDKRIRFSFEFYDCDRDDYCLSRCTPEQVRKALSRLREVNALTFLDLQVRRDAYHFHEVDWSQTAEKHGFPDSRLGALQPFQFALQAVNGQKMRVFGA